MPIIATASSLSTLESFALENLRADTLLLVANAAAGRRIRLKTPARIRVSTLAQLAHVRLGAAGWQRLEARAELVLLEQGVLESAQPLLLRLLGQAGNLEALRSQLTEFSRANLEPLVLSSAATSERSAALAGLYGVWLEMLRRERVFTAASLEQLAASSGSATRHVVAHGFAYLDAAQIALLSAVAANDSLLTLPCAEGLVFNEARRTVALLGWNVVKLPATRRFVGEQVAAQFAELSGAEQTSVEVAELGTLERECRYALSMVRARLETGESITRDLALVVRDPSEYLPTLTSVAAEFGVPLVSDHRVRVLETPLGEWLALWCAALASGFAYSDARRFFAHPLNAGRVRLAEAIRALAPSARAGFELWQMFADFSLGDLSLPSASDVFPQLMRDAVRGSGTIEMLNGSALGAAALNRVARALRLLGGTWTLEEFTRALITALDNERVAVLPARIGVRVLTPLAALGRSFKHVIALGLNDGDFPRYASPTGLLDPYTRESLAAGGAVLPGVIERVAIERALFFSAISSARESLSFTRPLRDLAGRVTQVSPFLRDLTCQRLELPALPFQSAWAAERSSAEAGTRTTLAANVELHRESSEAPNIYDGQVRPLPEWVMRTWSASQLHDLGSCRFKWFAKKPLSLRPLPQPPRQLDPATFGNVYHKALERVMLSARDRAGEAGRTATTDDFLLELQKAFRETEDALRDELRGSFDWRFERADALRALEKLLRWDELIAAGNSPLAFEQAFPISPDESAFFPYRDVSGAVKRLELRGSIDRLDTRTNGGIELIDYKSRGHVSKVAAAPHGPHDLEIQLTLYAVAGLVSLGMATFDETTLNFPTGASVHRARYINIREACDVGTDKKPVTLETDSDAWSLALRRTQEFVRDAMQGVERGELFPMPDPASSACTFCDAGDLCRSGVRFAVKREGALAQVSP